MCLMKDSYLDQSTPSAQRRQIITHKIDEDLRFQHFGRKCAEFLTNIEQQAAAVGGPLLPGNHQFVRTETFLYSCALDFLPLEPNTTIIVYPVVIFKVK